METWCLFLCGVCCFEAYFALLLLIFDNLTCNPIRRINQCEKLLFQLWLWKIVCGCRWWYTRTCDGLEEVSFDFGKTGSYVYIFFRNANKSWLNVHVCSVIKYNEFVVLWDQPVANKFVYLMTLNMWGFFYFYEEAYVTSLLKRYASLVEGSNKWSLLIEPIFLFECYYVFYLKKSHSTINKTVPKSIGKKRWMVFKEILFLRNNALTSKLHIKICKKSSPDLAPSAYYLNSKKSLKDLKSASNEDVMESICRSQRNFF